MKRCFLTAVLLLCSSFATADTLLSNMQLCSLGKSGCSWLDMSSVPTITQKNALDDPALGQLFFIFGNQQTFSPPVGETWTLDVTLSWGASSVSRAIDFTGDGTSVYGIGFDMGIPDTTPFPDPPNRTFFTLQSAMTDQSGAPIDSATNKFYLVRSDTVPEPSVLILFASGLVGLFGVSRRRQRR